MGYANQNIPSPFFVGLGAHLFDIFDTDLKRFMEKTVLKHIHIGFLKHFLNLLREAVLLITPSYHFKTNYAVFNACNCTKWLK